MQKEKTLTAPTATQAKLCILQPAAGGAPRAPARRRRSSARPSPPQAELYSRGPSPAQAESSARPSAPQAELSTLAQPAAGELLAPQPAAGGALHPH